MRMALVLGTAVAWLLAGFRSPAVGDEVLTSDGSRLVGKIERLANGRLRVMTEILGMVEIDASKVVSVATDEPIAVEFPTGDRLVGKASTSSEAGKSTLETALGVFTLPTGAITAMWPPGEDSPDVAAAKEEAEKTRLALIPQWTVKVEGGYSQTEGNTDTLEGRGRLDVVRKTGDDLLNFYLQATYSEQNDRRNRNEYLGGIKYENQIDERWFWYARTELEFDEFEDLDLRATAAAGAGRYWIKKASHEFKTRAGLGYRHEAFDNGRTRDDVIADLGLDYRVDIAPWMQFTHSGTYTPSLEDGGDYRLNFDTALLIPLKIDAWKLKLGMRNDYNSNPVRDLDRLDNTYYANVLVEIKEPKP